MVFISAAAEANVGHVRKVGVFVRTHGGGGTVVQCTRFAEDLWLKVTLMVA